MVAALGPGKFYGSSLPRPRFYSDVKLNGERIDPPLPVMDPLMAWAEEAHWSMGGGSTTRRRLQGRIEGNVSKLRVQRDALFKKSGYKLKSVSSPAPTVIKRRRVVGLVDDEEEDERRAAARKLGKDFENVVGKNQGPAENNGGGEVGGEVAARTRSKRKELDPAVITNNKSAKLRWEVAAAVVTGAVGIRNSPRLAKIGRSR